MDVAEATLLVGVSGVAISAVALGLLLWQLRLFGRQIDHAREAFVDEQHRARRHSTLEFFGSTQDRRLAFLTELPPLKDVPGTGEFIEQVRNERVATLTLRRFLNYYELIAAGVNEEIFDIAIIDHVSGSTIMNIWRRYGEYIQQERQVDQHSSMYEEIEHLAIAIAARRGCAVEPDSAASGSVAAV